MRVHGRAVCRLIRGVIIQPTDPKPENSTIGSVGPALELRAAILKALKTMNRFRAKVMQLNEWARFQELFEEFFVAADKDRRLALFIEAHGPSEESSTVLIPAFNAELLEEFSPGGWHDFPDARLYRWRLLVGSQSACKDFGLSSDDPTFDGDH